MAFTLPQTRYFLHMLPEADGVFHRSDAGIMLDIYTFGMGMAISVGGNLTPTGAIGRILTAYRSTDGSMTPTGASSRTLTAYRASGGTLTPAGGLGTIFTMVIVLGGELDFEGALSERNPAWLILDDTLRWMGEWDEAWSYDINDVVLYLSDDGEEWHVFVSKIGHNVGNIPIICPEAWHRLYQEQWL